MKVTHWNVTWQWNAAKAKTKDKTNRVHKRQQQHKQDKQHKTRLHWVPQRVKKRRRQDKIHRELPWVPQELSAKNEVQNWFVQQAQVVVKLNKQGKVKLKQTKLRKIPSPPTLNTKEQVDGHLGALPTAVLPWPLYTGAPEINSRKSPKMDVWPLELKSGYPVPRGLSRCSLEPKATERILWDKHLVRNTTFTPCGEYAAR